MIGLSAQASEGKVSAEEKASSQALGELCLVRSSDIKEPVLWSDMIKGRTVAGARSCEPL